MKFSKICLSLILLFWAAATPAQITGVAAQPRFLGNRTDAPAACSSLVFTIYYNRTDKKAYFCSDTNTWTELGGGGSEVGKPIAGGTSGSVLFVDADGEIAQDNSNLFWDATNARLGVGTNNPQAQIDVRGVIYWGNGTQLGALSYSTGLILGSFSNHSVHFYMNGAERARLSTNANFLIGSTTDNAARFQVTVEGATQPGQTIQLAASQTADAFQVLPNGSSTAIYAVDPNGNPRVTLSTPASSSAACITGTVKFDADYIYLCTATNTWKRAALSTF